MCFIRRLSFLALIALFGILLCHCNDQIAPSDTLDLCEADVDCPASQVCEDGVCVQGPIPCDELTPCPDGWFCVDGLCLEESPDGGVDGDGGDGEDGGGDESEPGPDIEVISPAVSDGVYQINFGNAAVGVAVQGQVILANVGDEDLRILNLNFEAGTDLDDFSLPQEVLDALPLVIAPGEQETIDVLYTATDGVTDHSVLDIISNDEDESLVQIHLLSEFKGEPEIALSPDLLAFGDVPVGQTSAPLVLTLSNQGTGNAVLTVTDVRFGVLSNEDFSLELRDLNQQPVTLPVLLNNGDAIEASVSYHPQQAELDEDKIVVVSDDPLNPSSEVVISGTGVIGDVTVMPSPLALGRVRVSHHAELPATISNSGGAPISLSLVALENLGGDWTLSSTDLNLADLATNPHPLDPGASVTVLIGFDPQDVGAQTGVLAVEHSGPGQRLETAVSGEGFIAPQATLDPLLLEYLDVQFDAGTQSAESRSLTFTLGNAGGEPLLISDASLDAASTEFTWQSLPPSIAPQDEVTIQVTFTPEASGPRSNSLLIDTNDPDASYGGVDGRLAVELSAQAIDPALIVSPAGPHDFGDQPIGATESLTITLISGTPDPLQIHDIQLATGNQANFSLGTLPDISQPMTTAGSFVTFDVNYHPSAIGTHYATVTITSSDIGNNPVTIDLQGMSSGCPEGFSNCDADPDCETAITTVADCGGCGIECSNANGSTACVSQSCDPICDPGFQSCDGDPNDGCETGTLTDQVHCGGCNRQCLSLHVDTLACTGGLCTSSCQGGYGNCTFPAYPDDDDGCETDLNSVADCGDCGRDCVNNQVDSLSCSGGLCTSSCLAGYSNCSRPAAPAPDDGCETHVAQDASACGDCNRPCDGTNTSSLLCAAGLCTSSCQLGYGNCVQPAAPADDDGCETAINTATAHCGGCGRACLGLNVDALACDAGLCTSTCQSGFGNCSRPAAPADDDGCETDLNTVNNCGDCGRGCSSVQTASRSCSDGLCTSTCQSGYTNCTQPVAPLPDDGCETHTDQEPDACGSCSRACANTQVASRDCDGGLCVSTCQSGYGNCTQPAAPAPDDGCETYLAGDPAACGACNRPCNAAHTNGLSCVAGLCSSACQSGYANCTQPAAPLVDDGCETYVSGDTDACGSCSRACSTANVASLACAAGVCTSSCTGSHGNCIRPTAPTLDDGCETDLDYAINHCGACGRACSTSNVSSPQCVAGVCTSSCQGGWANCTTPGGGLPDDGCETPLGTDSDCSGCGDNCDDGRFSHADGVCTLGTCTMGTCSDNYWDLDGDGTSCEYYCVYQGTTDLPDSGMVDANCDGIDGVIGDAIFVSVSSGSDSWPGTMSQPKKTIANALSAANSGGKDYLIVDQGTYTSTTITLLNGISIYGGYDSGDGWSRNAGNVTTLSVSSPTAIYASNISATTTLSHLTIEGGNNPAVGGSAYGIRANYSDGLRVLYSSIRAGSGGNGSNGSSPGGVAASGGNGNAGGPGCEDSSFVCGSCSRPNGGSGGSSSCGRTGGTGGRPGHNTSNGDAGGSGVGGTAGGSGTPDGYGNWNPTSAYLGRNGATGANGTDGGAGAPGFLSSGYSPASGGNGGVGAHGNGGGGGGGGGGGSTACDSYGGGGGGGGGGGCGGAAASGGSSAGGSFAVYLWYSSPVIQNCTLTTGNGGTGGAGGTGQTGGSGGSYGWGGDPNRPNAGNPYSSSGEQDDGSNGGRGGNGGAGGRGGHGGGGAGGPSIGIYRGGTSSPTIVSPTYVLGAAGAGGSSPGNAGPSGLHDTVYP